MNTDHLFTHTQVPVIVPKGGFGQYADIHWQAHGIQHALDRAPSVEVPVYRLAGGKAVPTGRTRKLYGIAAFHQRPRIVETVIAMPRRVSDIRRAVERTTVLVQRINPDMKLCPTHSGWLTNCTDNRIRIELLYALTGEEETKDSSHYSRRNSLDFHLKEQSRLLGTLRTVKVIRCESSIALHDGVTYIKSGTLDIAPHINPQKIIGYSDFSEGQLRDPSPILKGMAVIIPAYQWENFCSELNIDPSVQAVVPECTVKFDNGLEELTDVTVYSVFDTIISKRSTISVQAAERVPLTEHGERLMESTFRERIRELMEGYIDSTGMTIAELINHEFRNMRESSCDDTSEASFFMENAEVLSATHTALMTGLPMNDSEYVNATLQVLLKNRIKHIPLPGLTIPALSYTY